MTRSVFIDQSNVPLFKSTDSRTVFTSIDVRRVHCVSYPFAHQAVVEWQAYEVKGRLLDEVGIEDSDLRWLPGDVVCH